MMVRNRLTVIPLLLLVAAALGTLWLFDLGNGPEPIRADHVDAAPTTMLFGARLTGGAQPVSVETNAVGGFALQAAGGVAIYSLALGGMSGVTQAHIHQGAVGTNGDVVAFLFASDFSASGELTIEGTLRASSLIGPLVGDWEGFLTDLEAGNLYVNVHTTSHPAGELRGPLAPDPYASLFLIRSVPAGASLLGWSGLDSDSLNLLAANSAFSAIWWLGPNGWVADSPQLPSALRNNVALTRGTGIVVVATAATTLAIPVAQLGGIVNAVIDAVDDSSVMGVATLAPEGAGSRIRVAVQGLRAGDHANHLHRGSCEDPGSIHVPLTDLAAGDAGQASATTSWSENGLNNFRNGHYIAVHEFSTAAGIGAVIACGNLGPSVREDPGTAAQQGPTAGIVRLDGDSYDFSRGAVSSGGDFYVYFDGAESAFFANRAGQLGLVQLGALGSVALESVSVPSDGYSRAGVPIVEGDTYVSRAGEAEVDHYIVFRVLEVRLGEYVEIEFTYR